MANPLPQYSNDNPVLNPVQVDTGAKGYEQMANLFGDLAQAGSNEAVKINDTISAGNYTVGMNAVTKAKDDAELNIYQNPDEAQQTIQGFQKQAAEITGNLSLNSADRKSLQASIEDTNESVGFEAAKANIHVNNLALSASWQSNITPSITRISQELINDPEVAQKDIQNYFDNAAYLVKRGIITPTQFTRATDPIHTILDRHQEMTNPQSYDGISPAKQYHTYNAFAPTSPLAQTPQNAQTMQLSSVYDGDASEKNFEAKLINNGEIDWSYLDKASDAQYQQAKLSISGVSRGNGEIQTSPYPQLLDRSKQLGMIPLSTADQKAEKQKIDTYLLQLTNDPLGTTFLTTARGQQIVQESNAQVAAINKSTLSDQAKTQAISDNQNNVLNQTVNQLLATHFPASMIKFNDSYMQPINEGFSGDPQKISSMIGMVQSHTPEIAAYICNSLKKGNQQETCQLVNLSRNQNNASFLGGLTAANSDNQPNWNQIKGSDKGVEAPSDSLIRAQIAKAIAPQLNYLQTLPGGATRAANLLNAYTNYVHYRAIQSNDLTLSNSGDYIGEIKTGTQGAYNIINSGNATANATDTQLTSSELNTLGPYMTKLALGTSDLNSQTSLEALNKNPIQVTVDPSQHVIAYDPLSGKVFASQKLTNNLLAAARQDYRQSQLQKAQTAEANQKTIQSGFESLGKIVGAQ